MLGYRLVWKASRIARDRSRREKGSELGGLFSVEWKRSEGYPALSTFTVLDLHGKPGAETITQAFKVREGHPATKSTLELSMQARVHVRSPFGDGKQTPSAEAHVTVAARIHERPEAVASFREPRAASRKLDGDNVIAFGRGFAAVNTSQHFSPSIGEIARGIRARNTLVSPIYTTERKGELLEP